MKILVVGGGGREHAIIRKLKESTQNPQIFAAPGNGGIASDAVCVPIKATDVDAMVDFAVSEHIDYAVVAPDDPLVLGMVDGVRDQVAQDALHPAGVHLGDDLVIGHVDE